MEQDDRRDEVIAMAEQLASAISRRDVATIRGLLATGFVHRTHGGAMADATAFLSGIAQIPGEIIFVRLDGVAVDVSPRGALVTGIQHAQVIVDGQAIDDRRAFVDWFVEEEGTWRMQAAVDLP